MESPQPVVSALKTFVYSEPENPNIDRFVENPSFASKKTDPFLGVLEVYIHQARDIQNICIYHKQDVYAKICLTSDPKKSVTTQTVNGGGKNPIFNENLRIEIPTFDSSLKCEIYMLSRVRNYLEDQLLGFTLIPPSDIFVGNGKLEKEFILSSNDLFHSPAGFVQLSLSYSGVPLVVSPPSPPANAMNGFLNDSEPPVSDECDLGKIEFPDPKIANENQIMASEYFGLSSESSDDQTVSETGAPFGSDTTEPDSPTLAVTGAPFGSQQTESCDTPNDSKSVTQEPGSPLKDEPGESGSTNEPLVSVSIEPEVKVVQQDFVDLYMKSMQQFTESLAKMKLPLDQSDQTSSENSGTDQTAETPNGSRARVFYGSRAFF